MHVDERSGTGRSRHWLQPGLQCLALIGWKTASDCSFEGPQLPTFDSSRAGLLGTQSALGAVIGVGSMAAPCPFFPDPAYYSKIPGPLHYQRFSCMYLTPSRSPPSCWRHI